MTNPKIHPGSFNAGGGTGAPGSYDGGEAAIRTGFGERRVKLAAGDRVLYPSTRRHWVAPVTRDTRVAACF